MGEMWSVNSTLTVTNISAADGGNYTCIAENEATATLSVRLYLRGSQQMILYTTNGSVESIICAIEGFPVNYRWERAVDVSGTDGSMTSSGAESGSGEGSGSGMMLNSSGGQELLYTTISTGQVLEFNPAVFGDEGIYQCVAFSILGESQTSDPTVVTSE